MKKIFIAFALLFFITPIFAEIEIGGYSSAEIEFTPLGSSTELRMGRISEIGKFRLSNTSRKDVYINSIFLRNFSNADIKRSFQSFSLFANSRRVLIRAFPERRGAQITFSEPFLLKRGRSTIFSLQAQLIWSRKNKSIEFGIKNIEDFIACEKNTGASAKITNIKNNRLKEYTLHPGGIYYYRSYRRSFRR